MKTLTLSLFVKDGKVLLAMKKDGFGKGKWNGYGGKLKEGETILAGALREIEEESGMHIKESDLDERGSIDFYFTDKAEWNQRVHIFRVMHAHEEPKDTEEMINPQWFLFSEIPYTEMWAGDDIWIPYLLRGEKFTGEFHFSEEGKTLVKFDLQAK